MSAPDFVTTADLDNYTSGDSATLVEQAQATIRAYCGWHVAPNITETITLDGTGNRHLWLPSLFVTDVTAIVDEGTTLTTEDYDWSESGYLERRSGYWSIRPRQIQVTLKHGLEDIPADVVGVAVGLAARAAVSPAGVRREAAGAVSLEYELGRLLQDERSILDRYKLPPRT